MKKGKRFCIKKKISSDQLLIILSLCQTSLILMYNDFLNSVYTALKSSVFTGERLLAIDGISNGVITMMPILFDLIIFGIFLSYNRRNWS